MKPVFALAVCAIALSMPSLGSASILYSSLPDNDNSSPNVFGNWSGSASFTLDDDSILNSATLALWMDNSVTPADLDWSIQSSASGGSLFSGTDAILTNVGPTPVRHGDYSLYLSTFTLQNALQLAAGDYWLHISNCGTNSVNGCGWGLSAQNGNDFQFEILPNGTSQTNIGKFAFSIEGAAAAPEPSTWLMFAPALAGLATVIRRRA